MKLYLYNAEGIYLHEIEACEGITYHNSTKIKPDFAGRDSDIYQARFSKSLEVWEFEYKPDWIAKKAKELGLEIATISTMSEADLKSGKLPELDTIQTKSKRLKSK